MTLTRHGIREWLAATIVAVMLLACIALWGAWWMSIPVVILWLAFAAFFRDPSGRKPATDRARDLISPADGKISAIERLDHHEAIGGPAVVVRIFLSVLDVHVNRMPCDCLTVHVSHRPGKYLDARSTESARVNESNLVRVQAAWGEPIGIRQVSGAIARRIVCAAAPGIRYSRGERFGMIKFGSTTELIVPDRPGISVKVEVGMRVVGGVTVLIEA